jgi:spermidine/putrescine transport system ATP-binding protein
MTALVHIENISHAFGATPVLKDVSLSIAPKSYTVLLGPSGSGKTTLLSVLGGFLQPQAGRVVIAGEDCTSMPPAKRPTTTVFQDYALFPHMTIGANVGFGLRMRGVAKSERNDRARTMLDLVGLPTAFDKKPHELSGGQRQRVALARALVVEPTVLLLDEPLGALDLKLRRSMQNELKAIQSRVGAAFIHVTHDQEEAMALADHVVIMNAGRIEDEGSPEKVYARPATRFAASFMGESTILPVARNSEGQLSTALGTCAGDHVRHVAIRPEHIVISKAGATAEVEDVVYQGSFKRVTARLGEQLVHLRCAAEQSIVLGQSVMLSCDAKNLVPLKD